MASVVLSIVAVPWARYVPCQLGNTKPASDGCNQCYCAAGGWACTLVLCVQSETKKR
jgi:hypothetical protein